MRDEILGVNMRVVRGALYNSTANKMHHDRQAIICTCPSGPCNSEVKTILTYIRRLIKERRDSGLELGASRPMRSPVDLASIWRAVRLGRSKSSLSGCVMSKLDVVKVLDQVSSDAPIRDVALVESDNRLRDDGSS